MKTSSAPVPPRLRKRPTAHACLVLNLLALPGLGSFLAGQRLTGLLQMIVALAGSALTVAWFFRFLLTWLRRGEFPMDGTSWLGLGLVGVAVFLAAWCWSFATSQALLRQSRSSHD